MLRFVPSLKIRHRSPTPDAAIADQEVSVKLEETSGNVPEACNASVISKLKINQLSACTKKLRLDKYITTFRNESKDAKILLDVNTKILLEDFEIRRVEVLRVLKFANEGHLPS